jgi:TonB C terminal
MRITIATIFVAIMCAGSTLDGQTGPSSTSQLASPVVVEAQTPLGGVELLSDTEGVNFGQYLLQWHRITEETWRPLVPKTGNATNLRSDTVVIRFKILPDGHLSEGGMVLEKRSGLTQLDAAAWKAIANSKYPTLPDQFHGPYMELRAYFHYGQQTTQ